MSIWSDPDYCLNKVKENGEFILEVEIQTQEICMEAVKSWDEALRYIHPQFKTRELILASLRNGGCSIEDVDEQTEEYCIEAIKNTHWALELIENQTIELIELAVETAKKTQEIIHSCSIRWDQLNDEEKSYLKLKHGIRKKR